MGVALLLALSMVAALAVSPAAHASTVISITTSSGSTGCGQVGGTWDGTTNTCTSGSLGVNVPVGDTLDVGPGVTLLATNSSGAAIGNVDGTINNNGTMTGVGSIGLGNGGTVNNYGTITATGTTEGVTGGGTLNNHGSLTASGGTYGLYTLGLVTTDSSMSATSTGAAGAGVYNKGIIDISGSGSLAAAATGTSGTAFDNVNTTNSAGTVVASGYSNGLVNGGTFNTEGSLTAAMSNSGGYGVDNSGTINDYCSSPITASSTNGKAYTSIPCYGVTFGVSGVPSTVSWGVTLKWPFGTTRYSGTGTIVVPGLGGPITYTFDGSVTGGGLTYYCSNFCTRIISITGATTFTAGYATPIVLITTSDGSSVCGSGLFLGRTWSSATNTCSLGSTSFNVTSAVTLDVDTGVTLDGLNGAAVTNQGTINNDGTITGSSVYGISNYGSIANNGTMTGAGSATGVWNAGTIDNRGTVTGGSAGTGSTTGAGIYNTGHLDNYGTIDGVNSGAGTGTTTNAGTQWGIINYDTLNNVGSMTGTGPDSGVFAYAGAINNEGVMNATGTGATGFGIQITANVNNDGTVNATGPGGDIFSWNNVVVGNFSDYCGASVIGYFYGHPERQVSCSTVTFGHTGLPAGAAWGVTASWGSFVLPVNHTGTGAGITVPVNGSLTYSFDTPVTSTGMTYVCSSGCTGTSLITTAASITAGYANANPGTPGTTVACASSGVDVGSNDTCSATVAGYAGSVTGETVSFTQSGGTGAVSFPSGATCTLASGGACSTQVTVEASGTGSVTVQATYAGDLNNQGSSGVATLTVSPALSATLSPSSASILDNGAESATFVAAALGGSGVYSYSWGYAGLRAGSGCGSADWNCTLTASTAGKFSVSVTVTDSNGGTAAPAPAEVTVEGLTPVQPIPTSAMPELLNLTTMGGANISGTLVGSSETGTVVYNLPSINQTLLTTEIAQGDYALFPNALATCSVQVSGQSYIRVSGFTEIWWGGTQTNSTEFTFGGWESFLTPAAGWSSEPSCS